MKEGKEQVIAAASAAVRCVPFVMVGTVIVMAGEETAIAIVTVKVTQALECDNNTNPFMLLSRFPFEIAQEIRYIFKVSRERFLLV